jgi:protein SCO1/2
LLTDGYVAKVGVLKPLKLCLAAFATIALVLGAGHWLGSRLSPMADAGGRVFGPRAIPAFVGRDENANAIAATTLRGHVVIGNFIFTRCQGVCPTLTTHMIGLQRALPATNIRFISFSLDPDYDTPAVLKAYADRWKGDAARWSLVRLEPSTLGAVLAAIDSDDPEGAVPETEAHTTRFFLADARGLIRATYSGDDRFAMSRLSADAAALLR